MYNPTHFREDRIDVLHGAIARHPLAALVTYGPGGLECNHVPLLLDRTAGPLGTLRGHLARANPQWSRFSPEAGALVLFRGPDTYVSPSLYPSKQEHGKVVPTWNYVIVEAHGPLQVVQDRDWLKQLVTTLTKTHESQFEMPWDVSDAPADYIENQLRAIVGIEIAIERLEGKWKWSQNRPAGDRKSVVQSLGDPTA